MNEEVESHISQRFEILQVIGKGAYGVVWKAVDRTTKSTVALKKVFEAFQNETDAQRTFREVVILLNMTDHQNIIRLLDVIRADNRKDLYLVFEYMQSDVHSVIKSNILKAEHKQFIVYQILKALKFMHSGGVFHRDLKPSNVLINSDCYIKICDFGLARMIGSDEDQTDSIMTEYVATRWYRAPEIVFGSRSYKKSVDMWSVGCILAELINGNPLFPGKSTMGQIQLIIELLGKPNLEGIASMDSENTKAVLQGLKIETKVPFASAFKTTDPVVLDFLRRTLEFNPNRRMTVDEALSHEYVRPFREVDEETVMPYTIVMPHNDKKFSIEYYRNALYDESIKQVANLSKIAASTAKSSSSPHQAGPKTPESGLGKGFQKPSEKRLNANDKDKNRSGTFKDGFIPKNTSFKGSFLNQKPQSGAQPGGKGSEAIKSFLSQKKDKVGTPGLPSPGTPPPVNQTPKQTLVTKAKAVRDSDNFTQKLLQVKSKLGTDQKMVVVPKDAPGVVPIKSPKPKPTWGSFVVNGTNSTTNKALPAKADSQQPNENLRFKFNSNDKKWTNEAMNAFLGVEKSLANSFQKKNSVSVSSAGGMQELLSPQGGASGLPPQRLGAIGGREGATGSSKKLEFKARVQP